MKAITRLLGPAVLGLAILTPALTTGCAARVGYYDSYHHDYHHWDHDEDDHYRAWLSERHYEYRDFRRLDPDQQRDYWKWRHNHDHDH